jgi:hypothetical protein
VALIPSFSIFELPKPEADTANIMLLACWTTFPTNQGRDSLVNKAIESHNLRDWMFWSLNAVGFPVPLESGSLNNSHIENYTKKNSDLVRAGGKPGSMMRG